MIISVNPNKGLANSPDICIHTDAFPRVWEDKTYWKRGPCYWHQSIRTGATYYLFHDSARPRQIGTGRAFETTNGGGFGGAVFKLKVYNVGLVHVRGPWSGGAYCANQYLPRHVIEVTTYDSEGRRGHVDLPVDLVNRWLVGTDWQVCRQPNRYERDRSFGEEIRYEAMYKGNNKELFSTTQMDEAHARYQETTGNWLQRLQSDFINKVQKLRQDYEAVEESGEEEPGTEDDVEEHTSLGRSDVWFD